MTCHPRPCIKKQCPEAPGPSLSGLRNDMSSPSVYKKTMSGGIGAVVETTGRPRQYMKNNVRKPGAVFETTGRPRPCIKKQCPDAPEPFLQRRVIPVRVSKNNVRTHRGRFWDAGSPPSVYMKKQCPQTPGPSLRGMRPSRLGVPGWSPFSASWSWVPRALSHQIPASLEHVNIEGPVALNA